MACVWTTFWAFSKSSWHIKDGKSYEHRTISCYIIAEALARNLIYILMKNFLVLSKLRLDEHQYSCSITHLEARNIFCSYFETLLGQMSDRAFNIRREALSSFFFTCFFSTTPTVPWAKRSLQPRPLLAAARMLDMSVKMFGYQVFVFAGLWLLQKYFWSN